MAINVTAANTKLYKAAEGWVRAVYKTGQTDAEGKAITRECHLTKAAIEVSAGVLLPKARIKAVLEAEFNRTALAAEQEIAGL